MPVTGSGYQPMQPPLLPLCGGADAAGAILRGRGSVDAARAFAKTSNAPNAAQQHRLDEEEQRLSNAQRGSGGGGGNAMERFHATFRAALTQELEALVRDLHAAVVEVPTRAMVGELVARWAFVLATYRAHVAAEDEVVLPALAARVNNVAHAYELEHEAEDELFDGRGDPGPRTQRARSKKVQETYPHNFFFLGEQKGNIKRKYHPRGFYDKGRRVRPPVCGVSASLCTRAAFAWAAPPWMCT